MFFLKGYIQQAKRGEKQGRREGVFTAGHSFRLTDYSGHVNHTEIKIKLIMKLATIS